MKVCKCIKSNLKTLAYLIVILFNMILIIGIMSLQSCSYFVAKLVS